MRSKAFLTELGILVEQAASFEELERELPFTERRPDLVIADYRLPGVTTAEDVIAIFGRKWDADLPMIILTGEVGAVNSQSFGRNTVLLKKPASAMDISRLSIGCALKIHPLWRWGNNPSSRDFNYQTGAIGDME